MSVSIDEAEKLLRILRKVEYVHAGYHGGDEPDIDLRWSIEMLIWSYLDLMRATESFVETVKKWQEKEYE